MSSSVITHNPAALYQALQRHIGPNSLSNWSTQLMAQPVLSLFFTAWTVSVTYVHTAVNMVNVQHLSLGLTQFVSSPAKGNTIFTATSRILVKLVQKINTEYRIMMNVCFTCR